MSQSSLGDDDYPCSPLGHNRRSKSKAYIAFSKALYDPRRFSCCFGERVRQSTQLVRHNSLSTDLSVQQCSELGRWEFLLHERSLARA